MRLFQARSGLPVTGASGEFDKASGKQGAVIELRAELHQNRHHRDGSLTFIVASATVGSPSCIHYIPFSPAQPTLRTQGLSFRPSTYQAL
jgi:hypothetical protein